MPQVRARVAGPLDHQVGAGVRLVAELQEELLHAGMVGAAPLLVAQSLPPPA